MRSDSSAHVLLDLGSRSAKAYVKRKTLVEEAQITWALLEDEHDEYKILKALKDLIAPYEKTYQISAIGTEAMRRNSDLASAMAKACASLHIDYRTLSQAEEAQLILKAVKNHQGQDIINAGGGSIQIVKPKTTELHLLRFGISDLNRRFSLNLSIAERKVEDCITWIEDKLPDLTSSFIYTGGEEKYLRCLGLPIYGGLCKREDFTYLAQEMAQKPMQDLEALSPYDPKWMHGAIASNCIVMACLSKANAHFFVPSDLNISHGIIETTLEGKS